MLEQKKFKDVKEEVAAINKRITEVQQQYDQRMSEVNEVQKIHQLEREDLLGQIRELEQIIKLRCGRHERQRRAPDSGTPRPVGLTHSNCTAPVTQGPRHLVVHSARVPRGHQGPLLPGPHHGGLGRQQRALCGERRARAGGGRGGQPGPRHGRQLRRGRHGQRVLQASGRDPARRNAGAQLAGCVWLQPTGLGLRSFAATSSSRGRTAGRAARGRRAAARAARRGWGRSGRRAALGR